MVALHIEPNVNDHITLMHEVIQHFLSKKKSKQSKHGGSNQSRGEGPGRRRGQGRGSWRPRWDKLLWRSRRRNKTSMRAAVVEVEEEEDERYALDSVCRVLAGMPMPIGATLLLGGVNLAI
ncbi:hypothetical protein ZWY2020_001317 [Hordeum vulgare]|nr:hypothetical protein ZWY2020_001317 [Hordeum vulgare]